MSEKGDLANPWTSLDDIAQSGWHVESNGMTIYWRNKETREARPIPYWVKQLISRAKVEAEENTKRQIRETIGLSIK